MNVKEELREKAFELGFLDAGFTNAEPLDLYIKEIESRPEMYNWIMTGAFNTKEAATLSERHPWAKSIVVLIRTYYKRRFPVQLIGKIGRCYQVDERQEKDKEHQRIIDYIKFLDKRGIRIHIDGETPARMSAARAGIATYGKNCFAYARRGILGSSWIEIIPILMDTEIEPDEPSVELGCPSWCKNACIAACPTGALYAPLKMNPLKCIAYNSYYGPMITPMELREPMGIWIYGCDRCQEVCPRNQPWLNQSLPKNQPLEDRAADFDLVTLLKMNEEHHREKVWPLTFYISRRNTNRLQMNAARALGNQGDRSSVPHLIESLSGNPDEEVRGMCAWALGRLGGSQAGEALESRLSKEEGLVAEEITLALENM